MYSWCSKCKSVVLGAEHRCSIHGVVEPIASARCVEMWPLTPFEKELINRKLKRGKLGEGIFLVYNDRYKRRRIVTLDRPLVEIRMTKDSIHIVSLLKGRVSSRITGMDVESIIAANDQRLEGLIKASKYFAMNELEKFHDNNALISFSGGKDSIVLAHMLEDLKLRKVFIDTTIEFPETYLFIKSLINRNWNIDIVRAPKSFFSLCPIMGFPAPGNRWCCKTQKFEPLANYLRKHFGDEKVLVFEAVRRWESIHRLGEAAKREHWHIKQQVSVNPILDWTAMDVWLYIWKYNLPVNDIYNYFDRGGCWPCPFGSVYRVLLMKHTHPKFFDFLKKIGAIPRFRKFSIKRCTEGRLMKHVIFSDTELGKSFVKLLSRERIEVHNDGQIVCVPSYLSKKKIERLINKASAKLFLSNLGKEVIH